METWKVKDTDSNQRIDKYLRKVLNNHSLNAIFKAFRKKDVKVNGKPVQPDYLIQPEDQITIYLSKNEKKEVSIAKIHVLFRVVYEDDNVLLVEKPVGVSVQEDATSRGYSLSKQVLSYLFEKGEYHPVEDDTFVPSPVHRIDRNTSGLVLVAKNFATGQALAAMLRQRSNIEKYYVALVHGKTLRSGEIALPLLKDSDKNEVRVSEEGEKALTHYQTLKQTEEFSLVEVKIITGRTHQIRVHFAAIGHPLIGDNKYGNYKINDIFAKKWRLKSQFLHAYKLKFYDISGRLSYLNNRVFTLDLPEDKKRITAQIFGK